jgi:hypothetical protein
MNTISTMLKPLRTALEAVEALGLADDEYTVGLRAAIAAGEAELRREPVGFLFQHSETGRTRVVMRDGVMDADATWFKVGPLYLGEIK